jgi:DNA-3-methyladenine glycosylase II
VTTPPLHHLADACEVMAVLIDAYPEPVIGPVHEDKYFDSLVSSIIGQQLSVKAAATIESRVRDLVGELTPEAVSQTSPEKLRAAGLSNSKVSYVGHLADAFQDGTVTPSALTASPDSEVIATLTTIRGVGVWTAEMFLIFGLGRPDVWSVGDLGLTKGVRALFGDDVTPLDVANERWAPFRSLAAWYVWEHSDRGYPELALPIPRR